MAQALDGTWGADAATIEVAFARLTDEHASAKRQITALERKLSSVAPELLVQRGRGGGSADRRGGRGRGRSRGDEQFRPRSRGPAGGAGGDEFTQEGEE